MHHFEGREFDAVDLVCMNEGSFPNFTARTNEQYEEARRLFYAGLTRAKGVLIVVSGMSDTRSEVNCTLDNTFADAEENFADHFNLRSEKWLKAVATPRNSASPFNRPIAG